MDLIKNRESRGPICYRTSVTECNFLSNWLDNTLGYMLFSLLDLVVTTSLYAIDAGGLGFAAWAS